MIQNKAEAVIKKDSGAKRMLVQKQHVELGQMYRLFERVEGTLKYIFEEMGPYIEERGKELTSDEVLQKDPVKFTEKLLALKGEMDKLVIECFNNNPKFNQVRDKSFQKFMNDWADTPQFIAQYVDHFFRGGIRGKQDGDIEEE